MTRAAAQALARELRTLWFGPCACGGCTRKVDEGVEAVLGLFRYRVLREAYLTPSITRPASSGVPARQKEKADDHS